MSIQVLKYSLDKVTVKQDRRSGKSTMYYDGVPIGFKYFENKCEFDGTLVEDWYGIGGDKELEVICRSLAQRLKIKREAERKELDREYAEKQNRLRSEGIKKAREVLGLGKANK